MPFDVIGFAEATPGTGTPAIAAASGDTLYRTSGDDIYVQQKAPLLLGLLAAGAATAGRARLKQPSMPLYYEFAKSCLVENVDDPSDGFSDIKNRPLMLVPGEKLNVYLQNAADEAALIALFLGDGKITQQMLDAVSMTHIITGYADTTLTAYTWSTLTMTWDQDLPEGLYQIVGVKAAVYKAANPGIGVMRFVFSEPRAAAWRPGAPVSIMEGDKVEIQSIPKFPLAQWPNMPNIVFRHDKLPTIEMLNPMAVTDERVELALAKVG